MLGRYLKAQGTVLLFGGLVGPIFLIVYFALGTMARPYIQWMFWVGLFITAADVLVYLGDLEEVFAGSASRLAPGGLLAISTERGEGEGYRLQDSLRYAHSLAYLDRLAADYGLNRLAHREEMIRMDRGAPIIGHLAVYQREA